MTADLVAPALLALVAATAGGWLRRRVPPRAAVVLLTALAVLGSAAVFWALTLVVIGGAIGVPDLMKQFGWCHRVMAASHRAPVGVAVLAGLLLVVGTFRAVRFDYRWRRSVQRYRSAAGGGGIEILATSEKVAFAAPGRPGTVVVSEGLLDILDEREGAAVIAHEQGHLAQNHSRYLRIAGLAAAAVPVLVPLTRQLRFATERAADEAAVEAVGDRWVVARAIVRAALVTNPAGAMAISGDSVASRVQELVRPAATGWIAVAAGACGVAAATAAVTASTVQLHHLLAFGAHVCGLT